MDREYHRHLPHQIPEGVPIFLTWNLKGAFPDEVIERLKRYRKSLEKTPPRAGETARERRLREDKMVVLMADRFLDAATEGPMYLKDPAAAKIVEDSITFGIVERYDLFAWCVMANHAHALLTPHWHMRKITQGIKGYTAHQINGLQGARGRVFWQDESYDHWSRDEEEIMRIIWYIEQNPVVAGLCAKPEDWRWSSARLRANWKRGEALRREHLPHTLAGEIEAR